MYNNEKIGVGIITYNRPEKFIRLYNQVASADDVDLIVVVKNKDVDYGASDPKNISNSKLRYFNILGDVGVGKCKNQALQSMLDEGCQHIFLIEDDVIIKDNSVYHEYIETAIEFNLGHLNFCRAWNSQENQFLKPFATINKNAKSLQLFRRLCGDFQYFSRNALNDVGLYDDVNYINALEHAEHTYRMSLKKYYTPFNAFADIANSDKFISDDGIQSTIGYNTPEFNANLMRGLKAFEDMYSIQMRHIPFPTLEEVRDFFMHKPRYTVLCYIINKYEIVHEIEEKDPDAEYLLVTDDKSLTSKTWKVIYDEDLEGLSTFDKCYSIRFNLFKYASSDICVYIDANIHIRKSLKILIDKFNSENFDMCMMPHPLNSTFIPEYQNWIKLRGYPLEKAQKFIDFLQMQNYDLNYRSLFQGCFKIVRRGKTNSDFERLTMAFLKYLGTDNEIERLDQTVYSFVLNRYFNNIKILPVSEQILRSDYMTWYWHNSTNPNLNYFMTPGKPDIKYVFNKEVECLQI